MADDIQPGVVRDPQQLAVIGCTVGVTIAMEKVLDIVPGDLHGVIHADPTTVHGNMVDRADDIFIAIERDLRDKVKFQPVIQGDLVPIGSLQAQGLLPVAGQVLHLDCPVLGRGHGAVAREAEGREPLGERTLDYLFHGGFAVIKQRVRMQALQFHFTIFSCFTLWSMTWREASSWRRSAREMPASAIRTIT